MHEDVGRPAWFDCIRRHPILQTLSSGSHAAQMLERFQRRTKQDVDAARKNVLAAMAELARIRTSETLASGQDTGAAFDANVNRQRMSPTPPRTVPVSSTCSKRSAHYPATCISLSKCREQVRKRY